MMIAVVPTLALRVVGYGCDGWGNSQDYWNDMGEPRVRSRVALGRKGEDPMF